MPSAGAVASIDVSAPRTLSTTDQTHWVARPVEFAGGSTFERRSWVLPRRLSAQNQSAVEKSLLITWMAVVDWRSPNQGRDFEFETRPFRAFRSGRRSPCIPA